MITADLTGKRVLVTGGASGIGLATVELFARCGAQVALNHLADDERGPSEVGRLSEAGLSVVSAPGNVGDRSDAPAMVAGAIAELGGLDYLINNAGISGLQQPVEYSDLDAMTEEFWSRILSVNLLGAFRCAREAAPHLKAARGAIVSTSSVSGYGRRGSSLAYAASKAALINLTSGLARALAPEVRVNAVAPAIVDSPWTRDWPAERKRESVSRIMLGRMATPEDIAETMLFLAAGAAFITGQTIAVDGGVI